MTHAEIDALPAGRELDIQVAERVMRLRVSESTATHLVAGYDDPQGWGDPDSIWEEVPHYSTDIAAAWLIVEHLIGWGLILHRFPDSASPWQAEFYENKGERQVFGSADIAPLVICRAALKAVG